MRYKRGVASRGNANGGQLREGVNEGGIGRWKNVGDGEGCAGEFNKY